MRTNDPLADFARHDAEQARQLEKLPRCVDCGEPIQDEHYYEINDEPICEECLNDNHKKRTEDYIQ